MDSSLYQFSPEASKHNAFCWHTWEPQIEWRRPDGQDVAQLRRNAIIEDKRAAGHDPSRISGLAIKPDLDPKRFTVYSRAQADHGAEVSHTETLRAALRRLGPQTALELATVAGLSNSGLVGALLKNDMKHERVDLVDGRYVWVAGASDGARHG